jgi:RimJ/RimL family protein N-acetyltransferase
MEYITGENLRILMNLLESSPLHYPITSGILDGTFKGHALVDNTENPTKALVFHKYIGFLHYLGKNPTQENSYQIAEAAMQYRSERDYENAVEFAHYPESVAKIIENELGKIKRYKRISWEHDLQLFNKAPNPEIDDNTIISLIQKNHFNNTFVKQECEMFWETYEIFLQRAFGTIAHNKKDEFLGVCGACSDSDGFYEINIETAKYHRRKGIGYAVAYEYIKECYRRNHLPHWDCYDYNMASQGLAGKLGFREAGRYPLISWVY